MVVIFPLITFLGRTFSTYGIVATIGILISGFYFCKQIRNRGLDDNDAIVFLLWVGVGVFVGGHIFFAVTKVHDFYMFKKVTSFYSFIKVFFYLFSGSVFYGGLIGGFISGCIYAKVKKLPLPLYSDIMASATPLFHFFGRIGCFLGGCCYGIECPIGFTVHNNPLVPALNMTCRFPVQLLESVLNLILFLIFWNKLKKSDSKSNSKGYLFCYYLLSYAGIRFFDEFLRGDSERGFVFNNISTSQFVSLILILITVVILIHKNLKKEVKHMQ